MGDSEYLQKVALQEQAMRQMTMTAARGDTIYGLLNSFAASRGLGAQGMGAQGGYSMLSPSAQAARPEFLRCRLDECHVGQAEGGEGYCALHWSNLRSWTEAA